MKPFELDETELEMKLDEMVEEIFCDLRSQFLVLPKGSGFIEYGKFQSAYELLKQKTKAFQVFHEQVLWSALEQDALVFVVIRTILGLTLPEWAELARLDQGSDVTTAAARSLDWKARRDVSYFAKLQNSSASVALTRAKALISIGINYITNGIPALPSDLIHRLDKIDTSEGLISLQQVATLHVPYAAVLYERLLGRPFAGHRDAISELIGDLLESAIESCLVSHKITYRKTGLAQRIAGFEQAPDFIIPTEFSPAVIIEAKIAGDDGTARDKVTRILRLAEMRDQRIRENRPSFELIACIDGRGFGVRRQDMRNMLRATKGKVFTLSNLDSLIPNTRLKDFVPDP